MELKIVLELPIPVSKKKNTNLSMNWYRNAHYQTSNKAKLEVKEKVKEYLKETGQDGVVLEGPISVQFRYFKKTAVRTDTSNFYAVGAKFVYDALVDLGVLGDDDSETIIYEELLKTEKDKDNPRMEFLFRTVDGP